LACCVEEAESIRFIADYDCYGIVVEDLLSMRFMGGEGGGEGGGVGYSGDIFAWEFICCVGD
jgi:hypothetical protein